VIPVILTSVAYIAAQIFADIGSLRIVYFLGLSMDAGTIVYPFTFTLRDMVHKVAGVQATRVLIITAAIINIIMALYFWLVSNLPADPSMQQADFGAVLLPVWRIVFASIVAEIVSEFTDTEIYQIWVKHITRQKQWSRVIVSNAISIPLDSIIFAWIAFGGQFPSEIVWSIVLSNLIVKGITTVIGLPMIYMVKENPINE